MARQQVVLHTVPSLHVGGVNKALIVSLAELAKGPHRHLVCVLGTNLLLAPEVEALGVPVVSLGHRGKRDLFRTFYRLRRQIRAAGVTIVHNHQLLSRGYGGIAARSCGRPSVVSLHGTRSRDHVSDSDGPLRRSTLDLAVRISDTLLTTHFVAVSKSVAEAYQADHPGNNVCFTTIPNGVSVDSVIAPTAAPDSRLRENLGITPEASILLNVGRMVREKDQLTLVSVMAEVVQSHPKAVLLVAGRGTEEGAVKQAVADAGLEASVKLLGLRHDVPDLLHLADLVVVSSINEGFSVSVLEAMASGRAIVGTNIAAVAEAVRDGTDGLLVCPRDVAGFAASIRQLLDDPALRSAMGTAGRTRVNDLFTAQATGDALNLLYGSLAWESSLDRWQHRASWRRRHPG